MKNTHTIGNGSKPSVCFGLAMRGRLPFKAPSFHDSLKAFTNSEIKQKMF